MEMEKISIHNNEQRLRRIHLLKKPQDLNEKNSPILQTIKKRSE